MGVGDGVVRDDSVGGTDGRLLSYVNSFLIGDQGGLESQYAIVSVPTCTSFSLYNME